MSLSFMVFFDLRTFWLDAGPLKFSVFSVNFFKQQQNSNKSLTKGHNQNPMTLLFLQFL